MTDATIIQVTMLVLNFLAMVFTGIMALVMARLKPKVDDIHKFTNSILGKKMRDYATVTEEKAILTGLPEDRAIAAGAEVDAAAHELTQAKLDSSLGVNRGQQMAPINVTVNPVIREVQSVAAAASAPAPVVKEQPSVVIAADELNDDQIEKKISELQAMKKGKAKS